MAASGAIVISGLSVAVGVLAGNGVAVGAGDAVGFAAGAIKASFDKVAVAVCVESLIFVFVMIEYWVIILFFNSSGIFMEWVPDALLYCVMPSTVLREMGAARRKSAWLY